VYAKLGAADLKTLEEDATYADDFVWSDLREACSGSRHWLDDLGLHTLEYLPVKDIDPVNRSIGGESS